MAQARLPAVLGSGALEKQAGSLLKGVATCETADVAGAGDGG